MLKNSNLSILQIAQMIIQNYDKYRKGEHLKLDRYLKLFADILADSVD